LIRAEESGAARDAAGRRKRDDARVRRRRDRMGHLGVAR
jgi:hypothetical protein